MPKNIFPYAERVKRIVEANFGLEKQLKLWYSEMYICLLYPAMHLKHKKNLEHCQNNKVSLCTSEVTVVVFLSG